MKKILPILILCGMTLGVSAQQLPQFNMYMFNKVAINPATSGISGSICLTGFGRGQWLGYKDMHGENVSPRTYGVTFDMPVYAIESGVGMTVQYDMIGYQKNLLANLHYAFHQVMKNNHMLSFGISLGIQNETIDFTNLSPMGEDPLLEGLGKESATATNAGLGVHYNIPRKFYAGLSVANVLGSKADFGDLDYNLGRHYYLMAGYEINMEDKEYRPISITPGFLLKAAGSSVQLDLNAVVTYNDIVWGGLMYRISNAIGVMAGVQYYGISVGVSYDYTMTGGFGDHGSSIEVFVKYCYRIYPGVVKKSGYNTRNL